MADTNASVDEITTLEEGKLLDYITGKPVPDNLKGKHSGPMVISGVLVRDCDCLLWTIEGCRLGWRSCHARSCSRW